MTRSVAVGLTVFLLLASACTASALAASDAGGTRMATPDGFTQTVFSIEVSENGSAHWAFRYSKPLNDSQSEQFEAFAEEFEANESAMYRDFVNRSVRLASVGSNATGREMNASAFSRSASIEGITNERGVVVLSFRWSNFAVVDGDRVRVGDVFEGGLYLGENQRLVFEPGPSLAFVEARPDTYTYSGETLATSDSVTWVGEQQFTDNRPTVEFGPESAATTPDSGDGSTRTTETEPVTRSNGDMLLLVGVLVLVLGLVGAAVWQSGAFSRDRQLSGEGATDVAGTDGDSGSESGAIPDEELLSDDDRVLKLLEENGGRMKQVNIVDETEWSKSKVSMLLSEMEDDGAISKLRVGRENIISLAGHEPDAAGSPFDEEE